MLEPPPGVVLLAKFRAATSGVAGAMSTGRSKNDDVRYRAFVAVNSALDDVAGSELSSLTSSARMRSASGSVTYRMRVGIQLKIMPARVTTSGLDDSAASVLMPAIGVNEPGGASWSTPFCTCTC